MGFYVSVNGASLKTADQLASVQRIPLDRLMLETGKHATLTRKAAADLPEIDAPWCSMTSAHASERHLSSLPAPLRSLYFPASKRVEKFVPGEAVKGRNEPCAIGGVAWVVHCLHDVPLEEVAERCWRNTLDVFALSELDVSADAADVGDALVVPS